MQFSYHSNLALQVRGESGKVPALAESARGASELEHSAETQAGRKLPGATCSTSESVLAASKSVPAPRASAGSSKATDDGESSCASRQPPLQLHSGAAHEQQENVPPSRAAPAAQELASTPQQEEPWQEVKKPRRKSGWHAASTPSARKQGRLAPEHQTPALPPLRPRQLQTSAQPAEQALLSLEETAAPPHTQSGHAGAEQLPAWLSTLSCSQPQQPPHCHGQHPQQPARPQAFPQARSMSPCRRNRKALPGLRPVQPCSRSHRPTSASERFHPTRCARWAARIFRQVCGHLVPPVED